MDKFTFLLIAFFLVFMVLGTGGLWLCFLGTRRLQHYSQRRYRYAPFSYATALPITLVLFICIAITSAFPACWSLGWAVAGCIYLGVLLRIGWKTNPAVALGASLPLLAMSVGGIIFVQYMMIAVNEDEKAAA